MTRAQLRPYWRAVARAASALGLVGKDAVEEYRHAVMMQLVVRIRLFTISPIRNRVAMPCLAFGVDDGIAGTDRVRRCTDSPKRSGYSRRTGHQET